MAKLEKLLITVHHGFGMPAIRLANTVVTLIACIVLFGSDAHSQQARTRHAESHSDSRDAPTGNSTREARDSALRGIPFHALNAQSAAKIRGITEHSSYFRRMPSQAMECEPEMFTFMVRNPEVIVGIWDVMGITRVSLKRVSQYQHVGDDGAGTKCKMDLVFGNDSTHIYIVDGVYDGNMWPKELTGQSIIVLNHHNSKSANGTNQVSVTMDIFLKLNNLGADLVVRTLGPLVSKSADFNFTECLAFVSQVSQVAVANPAGIQGLAAKLTNVDPKIREQFVATANSVGGRSGRIAKNPSTTLTPSGYSVEEALMVDFPSAQSRVAPPDAILPSSNSSKPVSTRTGQPSLPDEDSASDSPTIQKLNRTKPSTDAVPNK